MRSLTGHAQAAAFQADLQNEQRIHIRAHLATVQHHEPGPSYAKLARPCRSTQVTPRIWTKVISIASHARQRTTVPSPGR
jgi:hypothetical protein